MSKCIKLIQADFCKAQGIVNNGTLAFTKQTINPITGNHRFLISGVNSTPVIYEHPRYDFAPLSLNKSLSIPAGERRSIMPVVDKNQVAAWINQQMNLDVQPDDIGFLVLVPKGLTVVASPNSMRFRNSFVIKFL